MSKLLLVISCLLWAGCGTTIAPADANANHGHDGGTTAADAPPSEDNTTCNLAGVCVCPQGATCHHTCVPGVPCHVDGNALTRLTVDCVAGQDCHVNCIASASCTVNCNGSLDCHVTGPSANCLVTSCAAGPCVVSCGPDASATYSGTMATCP